MSDGGRYYLEFKEFQAVISFLTIIPVSRTSSNIDINRVASKMYLFPLVGAIIGIMVGVLAYIISFYLPPLVLGFIVVLILVIITGVNHTDALADFADGIMTSGGKEVKHRAMDDPAVGSSGVVAVVLYITGMILILSSFTTSAKLIGSMITSEVIAKYVMVIQAYSGVSAWEGFSSPFTKAMKDKRKFVVATGLTIPLICFATGITGLVSLCVSMIVAMVIHYSSNKSFGGISGDVLGASNEITRLSSLIVLLSFAT
jgi:adenosylcobinamide-GDP ribazoletransferase